MWVSVCVRARTSLGCWDAGIEVEQDRSRSAGIVQIRSHEKDGQRQREQGCEQNNHPYL